MLNAAVASPINTDMIRAAAFAVENGWEGSLARRSSSAPDLPLPPLPLAPAPPAALPAAAGDEPAAAQTDAGEGPHAPQLLDAVLPSQVGHLWAGFAAAFGSTLGMQHFGESVSVALLQTCVLLPLAGTLGAAAAEAGGGQAVEAALAQQAADMEAEYLHTMLSMDMLWTTSRAGAASQEESAADPAAPDPAVPSANAPS